MKKAKKAWYRVIVFRPKNDWGHRKIMPYNETINKYSPRPLWDFEGDFRTTVLCQSMRAVRKQINRAQRDVAGGRVLVAKRQYHRASDNRPYSFRVFNLK